SASRGQFVARRGQLWQRAQFPGQVIEADAFAAGWPGHLIADAEQTEIMVVFGRSVGLQEVGAVAIMRGHHETEHVLVKTRDALGVADVQYRVVESFDFE